MNAFQQTQPQKGQDYFFHMFIRPVVLEVLTVISPRVKNRPSRESSLFVARLLRMQQYPLTRNEKNTLSCVYYEQVLDNKTVRKTSAAERAHTASC